MNGQAGLCPPEAHRPEGKTIGPSLERWEREASHAPQGSLPSTHGNGEDRDLSWSKYPWWLGYGARGRGGKERSDPHDELCKMVLLCHLSIRSLVLAYGPRLIFLPLTARGVLGEQLVTCWGILTLTSAVHLRQPIRALLGVTVCFLLAPICPHLQWVCSEPLASFILFHHQAQASVLGTSLQKTDQKSEMKQI